MDITFLFTLLSYCLWILFLISVKIYLTDILFYDILSGLKNLLYIITVLMGLWINIIHDFVHTQQLVKCDIFRVYLILKIWINKIYDNSVPRQLCWWKICHFLVQCNQFILWGLYCGNLEQCYKPPCTLYPALEAVNILKLI